MKLLFFVPTLAAALAHVATAQTLVTTTADAGPGSLRQALTSATFNDRIEFAIPGTGPFRIQPLSPLPDITTSIIIDGFTQPKAMQNSLAIGDNARLMIEIDGSRIPGAADGLRVVNQGGGTTIQGLAVSGFKGAGILLASPYNIVKGCFLGTGILGNSALPNTNGIVVENAGFNQIGGSDSASRNVISGNRMAGIAINGPDADANQVQGNYIGTDSSGQHALGNGGPGILIGPQGNTGPGGHNTLVGGFDPTEANVIWFNGGSGVTVWDANPDKTPGAPRTDQNRILGNSIFQNRDRSIDLTSTFIDGKGDGLTGNDNMDPDIGANEFQNFPTLPASCPFNGLNVEFYGALNSEPNQMYRIEIFVSSTCGPLGVGQGEQFVTSTDVPTDSQGNAAFSLVLPPTLGKTNYSATATDSRGNTSEFSPCIVAVSCCTNCIITNNPVLTLGPSGAGGSGAGPSASGSSVAPSGAGLTCSWSGEGFVLQTASSPTGPWASLTLGTLVGTNEVPQFETFVPLVSAQQFFRLADRPVCPGSAVNH